MTEVPLDESPALNEADSLFFSEDVCWTPQIEEAAQLAAIWITCDQCGACFWGLPRVGKSDFARYFENVAMQLFGGTVVVIRFHFGGGSKFTKPDKLLARMLNNLGIHAVTTRNTEALLIRLMKEIWRRCTPTTRRIVVICDELQNVHQDLYGEFATINWEITEKRYIPFLMCIGQPELQSTVANVERSLHVMGRQFQEVREFRGLTSEEIVEFLVAKEGEDRRFTRRHFPQRAATGWSIVELAPAIQQAVFSLHDLGQMGLELFFPMSYLRQTLNYLFLFLSNPEFKGKAVTPATVIEAFERNGFKKLLLSYAKNMPPPAPPEENLS